MKLRIPTTREVRAALDRMHYRYVAYHETHAYNAGVERAIKAFRVALRKANAAKRKGTR